MEDFVKVYKSWLASRTWAAEGHLGPEQRKTLALADSAKQKAWNSLSGERRKEITEQLVKEGILPHAVLRVMGIFDANVVGI